MRLTTSLATERIKLYFFVSATIIFHSFSYGQVYETKELKEKAEKEIRLKNKRLGISETKSNKISAKKLNLPENTEKKIFNTKYLSKNTYAVGHFNISDPKNKYTSEKINKIKNSIAKNDQRTDLIIDLDNNLFYRINKKTKEFKSNAFHKNERIVQLDCKSCNYPPFEFEFISNKKFNLIIPSDDEENLGLNIVYTFIKIKN